MCLLSTRCVIHDLMFPFLTDIFRGDHLWSGQRVYQREDANIFSTLSLGGRKGGNAFSLTTCDVRVVPMHDSLCTRWRCTRSTLLEMEGAGNGSRWRERGMASPWQQQAACMACDGGSSFHSFLLRYPPIAGGLWDYAAG